MRKPVLDLSFLVFVVALQLPGAAPAERPGRLDLLDSEIARHDQAYYRDHASTISDIEYDALQEQRAVLADGQELAEIGDDRQGGFEKFMHPSKMRSLKKAHGSSGLEDFYDRVLRSIDDPKAGFVVEPKVDGIAVNLVYENGSLIEAVTRGNGSEGDVITESIQDISDLPIRLDRPAGGDHRFPRKIEIRGELYVEKHTFAEINRLLDQQERPQYATPRSLAFGLSRSGTEDVDRDALRLVVFDWGIWEPESSRPSSYSEFKSVVRSLGFRVLESCVSVAGKQELLNTVSKQLKACRASPVPCDGVVVKLDDVCSRDILGRTELAPNWAIACKFPAKTASTTIKDIHLQMGRTGSITPVAELDPIEINRRRITRVNLNSPSFVQAMDVRVGDRVVVALSGDVIPVLQKVEIQYRTPGSVSFEFPEYCPFCHAEMEGATGGSRLRCPNYRCPERLKQRLEYFADKLGLVGMGPVAIGNLIDQESVGTYSEFLNHYCQNMSKPPAPQLWQVLAGIGIPNLGSVSARKLATLIGCLDEILLVDTEMFHTGELPERVLRSIEQYVAHPDTGGELRELIEWFNKEYPASMRRLSADPESGLPSSEKWADDRHASSQSAYPIQDRE